MAAYRDRRGVKGMFYGSVTLNTDPTVLHTPSILGVWSTFRIASTESIAVLAAQTLRVLRVLQYWRPKRCEYWQFFKQYRTLRISSIRSTNIQNT